MNADKETARAERGALQRVEAALVRAETEEPQLAAPDGTVSVQIDDLRSTLAQMDRMRDTLALGKQFWRERWYGSEPERGSAICVVGRDGGHGELLAYLGGDEKTHHAVQSVVAAHNAALAALAPSS